MDKLVWVAMSGAKAMLTRQDIVSQNLANGSTDGYRAERAAFRALLPEGEGAQTRVYGSESTQGFDASAGPISATGRPLDVAIRDRGWFAVQGLDGNEAYTRAGGFDVSTEGLLVTRSGLPVMGEGGPIAIPQGAQAQIGSDGTVSARQGNVMLPVGRLKMVNPPANELRKGADGLVRTADGEPAPADPNVRVVERSLEGSNVNTVEAMVDMIAAARQFEMNMKMLQNAEQNAQRATQLLSNN